MFKYVSMCVVACVCMCSHLYFGIVWWMVSGNLVMVEGRGRYCIKRSGGGRNEERRELSSCGSKFEERRLIAVVRGTSKSVGNP